MEIQILLKSTIKNIFSTHSLLQAIVHACTLHGGICYMVGGAVRDMVLGRPVVDIDIEVHGLESEQVYQILQQFGVVNITGKAYGVMRLVGLPIDWSVPRTDTAGRKPTVHIDPAMGFKAAAHRRDLTMNAMGINLHNETLEDPYGGYTDIQEKVLRAVDVHTFVEDPLRFYRVMQFIGRFDMQPDGQLDAVCKTMSLEGVSRERIEQEFKKLLLIAVHPSTGIRWLARIGRLKEIVPELAHLEGVEQNPAWHPEGDVFEHSMQALDIAAQLDYKDDEEKLMMLYAALLHDVGKATSTQVRNGKITSYGHEIVGVPIARQALHRITKQATLIDPILVLIRHHMAPAQFGAQGAKAAAYKRLALQLCPHATVRQLVLLAMADKSARALPGNPVCVQKNDDIDLFAQRAHNYGVWESPEKAVITAHDIMDIIAPGPQLGAILKQIYEKQVHEGIADKNVLKEYARTLVKK